jgi:rhamnose transport system permease protein
MNGARARLVSIGQQLLRWETFLAAVLIADLVINSLISPWFLDPLTLSDATFNFTEKALIALPMALLIIGREIDVSVAGTLALCSVVMGLAAQHGLGAPSLAALGLATGALCGAVNGLLVAMLRVPAIVATIGTMSLFRGIASGVLGDRVLKGYPPGFSWLGQGYVYGVVSFELLLFALCAVSFALYLHRTIFGRRLYALGSNPEAAAYSGVHVTRYRFWLFVVTGMASGAAAVLLTSRLGSTRPSIAQGWELEVISMVILGGVSVAGGRGTIPGVVLAAVLMGFVTFGLGLKNIPGIVMQIIVGVLLIVVVGLPELGRRLGVRRLVSDSPKRTPGSGRSGAQ